MGPYVLRSVNAHFKLWDEGVHDSFTEKLAQAPVGVIPNIPLNCTCTTSAGDCGSSLASSQCAASQRIYNHTCSLQGCDGAPASSCVDDPSCCSAWAPVGCGTVPLGQPPTSTNCNYGYQILAHQCGSNNTIECNLDPACPPPACLGILSPGAIPCPNEPPANGILNQNNGISYVQSSANCNSNATCQYYCDTVNSYFLNPTGTSCSRIFQVALVIANSTNNKSFIMCAGSSATITSITVTDISSPQTPPGCGQPHGNPGEQCQISVIY